MWHEKHYKIGFINCTEITNSMNYTIYKVDYVGFKAQGTTFQQAYINLKLKVQEFIELAENDGHDDQ